MAGALLGSIPVGLVSSFFVEPYVTALTGAVKGQAAHGHSRSGRSRVARSQPARSAAAA